MDMGTPARRKRVSGLTIIELMIVIAIVSILLVIAVPVYQQYSARARVSEGLNLANPVLLAVAEYYQSTSNPPPDNSSAGVAAPGDFASEYVDTIEVGVPSAGQITITYDNSTLPELGGDNTLVFTPTIGATNVVTWQCDAGTLPAWARPSRCR